MKEIFIKWRQRYYSSCWWFVYAYSSYVDLWHDMLRWIYILQSNYNQMYKVLTTFVHETKNCHLVYQNGRFVWIIWYSLTNYLHSMPLNMQFISFEIFVAWQNVLWLEDKIFDSSSLQSNTIWDSQFNFLMNTAIKLGKIFVRWKVGYELKGKGKKLYKIDNSKFTSENTIVV